MDTQKDGRVMVAKVCEACVRRCKQRFEVVNCPKFKKKMVKR